jgi:hypothetical protein
MKYRYRSIAALISALLEVYWVSVDEFLVVCVDIQEPVHSDSSAEWETSQLWISRVVAYEISRQERCSAHQYSLGGILGRGKRVCGPRDRFTVASSP